ncbi:hypothetical protein RvY_16667-2 [Ramazzottius varieornatus]|uniref:Uncharacterized protein n=1 Tax=Ramazzottius varieornatus TaxID=947166 RepID=A0A1D1W0H4_RAMVA|nr:hypothetical protein RvY_16667-2 [Ramazzottius varieornatus]
MEVKIWRAKQMAMLRFCGLINDCFSLILFFIYWLDFLTLLGYTSSFTKISSGEPITTYLRLVFNCIVFASYGALIPIPLVCAYENSGSLGFMAYRLKVSTDGRTNTAEEAEVVESMEELERVCRCYVCMFNGAKLIYYTRGFLVGITTLVLSVTLIVREFISGPFDRQYCRKGTEPGVNGK